MLSEPFGRNPSKLGYSKLAIIDFNVSNSDSMGHFGCKSVLQSACLAGFPSGIVAVSVANLMNKSLNVVVTSFHKLYNRGRLFFKSQTIHFLDPLPLFSRVRSALSRSGAHALGVNVPGHARAWRGEGRRSGSPRRPCALSLCAVLKAGVTTSNLK